jgi:hypothetical protein
LESLEEEETKKIIIEQVGLKSENSITDLSTGQFKHEQEPLKSHCVATN